MHFRVLDRRAFRVTQNRPATAKVAKMPKKSGKKAAPVPSAVRKGGGGDTEESLYVAKKRNYGIGQAIQPRRDLGRMLKWPRHIRIQRQRKILKMRLKIPPSVAQFGQTLDLNMATNLFTLLNKYKPEEKAAKKARLAERAAGGSGGGKPYFVKCGLNHVTTLIEQKKAKLVVIAHDVDPIEMIVWLPALCRAMDTQYCVVKGKARLGAVVHKKTATCLAITDVKQGDASELAQLCKNIKAQFNEREQELTRTWGGGIMGVKNVARMRLIRKKLAKEAAKKAGM